MSLNFLIWSAITLVMYFVARTLYLRWKQWWLSPLVLAPVLIMLCMIIFHVNYGQYISGTHWLIAMLGPVTVSFAVPIYEHRELLRRYWPVLIFGALVGSCVSLGTAYFLASLLGLPHQLQLSIMPRSITTPFAVTVSGNLGGLPDLTAVFVVATGIFGASLGGSLLQYLRLRSEIARGALLGMGAHGAGVSKANEIGVKEGTVAGLVMILAGLLNLALLPVVHLLLSLGQ